MPILAALIAIAALLAVTIGVGGYLRWRQNRPRRHIAHEVVDPSRLGADGLGAEATLLQFSTELCARCPHVHRTLAAVADSRPDIARHFHVLQTPTTLILDRDGVVQTRFGGVPGRDVIELELARLTGEPARA